MEYKESGPDNESTALPEKPINWEAISEDWSRSGLSQQKYCQQKNLVYSQFMYWRGRLKKKKPQLLPVRPKPDAQCSSGWIITINSQLSLHIKNDLTEEKLLRLIKATGVLPC